MIKLIIKTLNTFIIKFKINNRWVIKSGTDFREFSNIEITKKNNSNDLHVNKIERYIVTSEIEENIEIKLLVDNYMGFLN